MRKIISTTVYPLVFIQIFQDLLPTFFKKHIHPPSLYSE